MEAEMTAGSPTQATRAGLLPMGVTGDLPERVIFQAAVNPSRVVIEGRPVAVRTHDVHVAIVDRAAGVNEELVGVVGIEVAELGGTLFGAIDFSPHRGVANPRLPAEGSDLVIEVHDVETGKPTWRVDAHCQWQEGFKVWYFRSVSPEADKVTRARAGLAEIARRA